MTRPSIDIDIIYESATHGTAQSSCASSSPRRNIVLAAERATYSGSIDSSVNTNLHDATRVSYQETPDSPGISQTAEDLYRESQARVHETYSGPPVGQAQSLTLDEGMVDGERTVPLTTNSSSTNSQEFLEWKANGRLRCQKCLKKPAAPLHPCPDLTMFSLYKSDTPCKAVLIGNAQLHRSYPDLPDVLRCTF